MSTIELAAEVAAHWLGEANRLKVERAGEDGRAGLTYPLVVEPRTRPAREERRGFDGRYSHMLKNKEDEARFETGYADGENDRRRKTGRAIGNEPGAYAMGYVAGRYEQLNLKPVKSLDAALASWRALTLQSQSTTL